jgi:hypothetical protein
MEELVEALAIIMHQSLPDYFSKSHEVKLTPYFDKLPDKLLKENDDKDEIYLFVDISGETERVAKLSETEFWKKEENHQWKSSNERYGVIFRDGKYFRSEKWTKFCRDEADNIVALIRYTGYLIDYIEKNDKTPDMFLMTEDHLFIICSTKLLEESWKT